MAGSVGPSTYGPLDRMLATARSLQGQQEVLQMQTTTGKVSQSYAGLAPISAQVLSLSAASIQRTAYTQAIEHAQGKASVMQDALTEVNRVASAVSASALGITGTVSPSVVQTVAGQARLALQQIASLMNTKFGDEYVFAGADSSNPPLPQAETISASGMFTQIGVQVAALASVPTAPTVAAVIASTVSIASSTASGTTVFSAYLSSTAAGAALPSLQVSDFQRVVVDLPANRNVGAVSDPAIAGTGSAISDILRSLSVLANITGAMASNPDFAVLVCDAAVTLGSAAMTVSEQAGQIGLTQNTMTAATERHASLAMIFEKQLSLLTDVDLATAITRVQAVNAQLQASYQILSQARGLNLASFL